MSALVSAARDGYEVFLAALPEDSKVGRDPIDWQNFLDFIREIFAMFENCSWFLGPERAVETCKSPNRRETRWLRLRARRKLGRQDYSQVGEAFVAGVLAVGAEMTEDRYCAIAAEV